jgi:hypothetical protein
VIVTARFRVNAKRAAQLEQLLRGLSAHISLESDPEIDIPEEVIPVEAPPVAEREVATESTNSAASEPQEVASGESELRAEGHENDAEDAGNHDSGGGLSADGDGEVAGPSGASTEA